MTLKHSLSLAAVGMALAITPAWSQTTPTGTVNSTTYPQGAVAPDSSPMKASRDQKKNMRQTRRNGRTNGTTNTSVQDAEYRESSVSDGTAINNSNVTNYNSNNVTTAPTGAGSNPNMTTVMDDTAKATSPKKMKKRSKQ